MTIQNYYPFNHQDLNGDAIFFIAGPCVIESYDMCSRIAGKLSELALKYNITIIFKASYDKANRTSFSSFRGIGIDKGLKILEKIRKETNLPVLTDIHSPAEAATVAHIADILQIPAFLCRQTDLLAAAGKTGNYVNIKKGQFMAPKDMKYAAEKTGTEKCLLTERGTFFGYNRLVVDYSAIHSMKEIGFPLIFDATHSVQIPGGGHACSSGNRELAIPLALAAICQRINGLFFEVHPDPESALCDGANTIYLSEFEKNLPRFIELHEKINSWKH